MGRDHRARRGEITRLVAFLEEHCEAVEADLARFYPGVRLRQLFTGELTWRELGVYIERLPLESATQTEQLASLDDSGFAEVAAHEQTHGPWSHTDLLLAAVADAIERLTFVQLRRAGVTPDMPKPIPRPGVNAKVRAINPAAAAYLNNLRAKGG